MRREYIITGIVLILLGISFGTLGAGTTFAVVGVGAQCAGDALSGQFWDLPVCSQLLAQGSLLGASAVVLLIIGTLLLQKGRKQSRRWHY